MKSLFAEINKGEDITKGLPTSKLSFQITVAGQSYCKQGKDRSEYQLLNHLIFLI
jgi:hypothetical protein